MSEDELRQRLEELERKVARLDELEAEVAQLRALITKAAAGESSEDRDRFLAAAADFNTAENWPYVEGRFGPGS
ncbi:hypothetical protein [Streptomyces sp. N35]|uniref:hypothetical protein n=1 Tax=Streptomyces sp. N35 TaxID=2795730 RepID=UPI0018F5433F|nr:hypothetical protein [Streptomyces sp. N35]